MIRYKNYILWPDKVEKRHFVRFFLSVVGVLFVIRLLFPSVMTRVVRMLSPDKPETAVVDTIMQQTQVADSVLLAPLTLHPDLLAGADGQKLLELYLQGRTAATQKLDQIREFAS